MLEDARRGGKGVECATEIQEGRIGDALSWRHFTSDFIVSFIVKAIRMLASKFHHKLYHQQPAGYQPLAHLSSSSPISSRSSSLTRQRAQPLLGEHPYHNCLYFPPSLSLSIFPFIFSSLILSILLPRSRILQSTRELMSIGGLYFRPSTSCGLVPFGAFCGFYSSSLPSLPLALLLSRLYASSSDLHLTLVLVSSSPRLLVCSSPLLRLCLLFCLSWRLFFFENDNEVRWNPRRIEDQSYSARQDDLRSRGLLQVVYLEGQVMTCYHSPSPLRTRLAEICCSLIRLLVVLGGMEV